MEGKVAEGADSTPCVDVQIMSSMNCSQFFRLASRHWLHHTRGPIHAGGARVAPRVDARGGRAQHAASNCASSRQLSHFISHQLSTNHSCNSSLFRQFYHNPIAEFCKNSVTVMFITEKWRIVCSYLLAYGHYCLPCVQLFAVIKILRNDRI